VTQHDHMRRRELAERRAFGLCVRLFWYPETGEIRLRYEDEGLDEGFTAVVDREHALDAFLHPNCYRPIAEPVPAAV